MNAKLKGILHNAWNEPRHFFLWLSLLSLCGLVLVAVSTGFGRPAASSHYRPAVSLALLALGCGLCFLVSLAAFVLAWISPVRRGLEWLLARRFLVLVVLITLVALFYSIENWRGRRAWQAFKRPREAQGERFDFAGLTPPAVPAELNFFETPLWTDLRFVRSNDAVLWSDTNWGSHVFFNVFGPKGGDAPSPGNWTKAQRVDLGAWQTFYRGTNNVFQSQGGPSTNYFPIAKEPQSPGADVLMALSKFNANRQLLIEAAARPQARFWIDYDDGPAMLLPHLARLKGTVQYLSLQANAALKAGDKETTLQNLKLIFRLIESIRGEPILISHLVRMAALQIGLQTVWEGLADRQWTDSDLSLIESELGQLDLLADFHFAMLGEQACNLWALDFVHRTGLSGWEQLVGQESEGNAPAEFEKFLSIAVFRLIPAGWFDQNKIAACRFYERYVLPVVNEPGHVVLPALVRESETAFEQRPSQPYSMLAKALTPFYARAAEKFARAQAFVDQARLACALERYRLAKGQFPEALDALVPQFTDKLPRDIIGSQSLRYHRTTDGHFVLYSVGWNETDEGGKVELTKQGNPDMSKGDWVWPAA